MLPGDEKGEQFQQTKTVLQFTFTHFLSICTFWEAENIDHIKKIIWRKGNNGDGGGGSAILPRCVSNNIKEERNLK